jgi:serine/threonine protein kinase
VTNGVRLAAPLKHRDGTIAAVVVVGPKRADRSFDRRDLWLAATLIAGAAAAWDADAAAETSTGALGPHSNQMGRRDEAAFECSRCGMVAEGMAPRCGCHGGMVLASLPRQLLGKFVVERRVGAGGMGVVYLARDTALDRDVALKTLPDLRDGTVARLRDEARAMAALNHESLATIFGLEIWRRTPVLVVEYFPRGTLARRLAAGPLPPADVVALGIALARALAYMHARGVLHRDLKPSNIALTATGAPKLLDFGLATFIDTSASGTDSPLGRGASFLGTPAYLPPEAFQGAPPDPAFDLWALSVVLVEAITGKKPFDRGGRGRMRQLALAVDPAGVRPSPPRSLSAFFARSLALRPESRFQTSFEMQSALEALHDPSIDLE